MSDQQRPGIMDLILTMVFIALVAYPGAPSLLVAKDGRGKASDYDVTAGGWAMISGTALVLGIAAVHGLRTRKHRQ
jgi:hypothetical protein